jgi:hypothetical protein
MAQNLKKFRGMTMVSGPFASGDNQWLLRGIACGVDIRCPGKTGCRASE